ncbi:MAG TPA: transcriptional repressor [Leptospiraceae bacterium]|nr:transcriptional repressor [Leptospiraceae bacterium]HMW04833.1 transcriptional repressor [Leptospiraceae bacterium]HMX34758.1 transcriptional repressor [Leptospiraceae bacterium]HMY30419.1 transcriptional repressor [Leptospiraceae bacterium]HMZ64653.1 transcriptional repressor [Leptospiraceae bacterium]
MKKLTRHRKIILENMQSRKDHPTAKMVYDSIRSNVKSLSFATVYNSLEYLYNNGYIKKLDSFSDSAHYDAVLDKHSHLICRHCGKIIDFPNIDITDKLSSLTGIFEAEDVAVTVRGFCQTCLDKK